MNRSLHRSLLVLIALALTASPDAARAQNGDLEHCDQPLGTLAVVEPQDEVMEALRRFSLDSPTSLIRMMVQQSNCFLVVERGLAMQNIMQERALAQSGQLQQNQNVGGGQMVAADYVLSPAVLFSEGNAGGVGGAVAGLIGRRSPLLGAVAGGLRFKEAQTSLLLADTRSGIQVASAQGQARRADFSLGMLGFGGGGAAAGGAYTNTNEGKVIAASFLDNYNQIVVSVRSNPALRAAQAGDTPRAGAVFAEGQVLAPKIDNVRLLSAPQDGAPELAVLTKADELVFLGEEEGGYVHVLGSMAEGWVRKTLVEGR